MNTLGDPVSVVVGLGAFLTPTDALFTPANEDDEPRDEGAGEDGEAAAGRIAAGEDGEAATGGCDGGFVETNWLGRTAAVAEADDPRPLVDPPVLGAAVPLAVDENEEVEANGDEVGDGLNGPTRLE